MHATAKNPARIVSTSIKGQFIYILRPPTDLRPLANFESKAASIDSVILSEAYKDKKPQSGTGIAEEQGTNRPVPAPFRAYVFGSSSSVMLRLVGHGIVSEKNSEAGGPRHRLPHFIGERRNSWRRCGPLIPRAVCSLSIETVKFKLSMARFGAGANYCGPRFSSSFKIMVSAISFMDLRICWLCRWIAR